MRQWHSIVCTLIGLCLLTGIARAQQDKAAIDRLYQAAKKEGSVVIWGPNDPIIYQKAQEALNKQYPGIKIEHFEILPEPIVQRLKQLIQG